MDSKSKLKAVSTYGKSLDVDTDLSAWSDSILSEAVREKRIRTGAIDMDSENWSLLAVPFIANGVPLGLAALLIESENFTMEVPDELGEVISKLGAFYLNSLDFGNYANSTNMSVVGPEDLTTRQLSILAHIESGLVNLEIAKILMLSESTIRQELSLIHI